MTATALNLTERVRSAWDTERDFWTPARILSRQWDYGTGWVLRPGQSFPIHRVTWLVDTGEVFAERLGPDGGDARYLLLGRADRDDEAAFEHRFAGWAPACLEKRDLAWWTRRLGTGIGYVTPERAARAWARRHGYQGNRGGWIARAGAQRHICQGWGTFTDVLIRRGLIRRLEQGYMIRDGSL